MYVKMAEEIKDKKCVWKIVVKHDLEKLANGNDCITLSPDKPCYKCDGTKKYARKINYNAYWPKGEK